MPSVEPPARARDMVVWERLSFSTSISTGWVCQDLQRCCLCRVVRNDSLPLYLFRPSVPECRSFHSSPHALRKSRRGT